MNIVYKLTNIHTNKSYIGITKKSLKQRIKEHNRIANSGKGFAIHAAIRKYGWTSFNNQELYYAENREDIYEAEKLLIKEHNTKGPHGYNEWEGGNGSPEHIIRVPLTLEQRQRISEATKRGMAKMGKDRLSQIQKKRFKDNPNSHGMMNKKHKKSSIQKMKEAHSRISNTPEHKARVSALFKAVWADPVKREILLKHIQHPTKKTRALMALAKQGHIPWNKGKKNTYGPHEATRIREAQKERDKIDPARVLPDWLVDLRRESSQGFYWK